MRNKKTIIISLLVLILILSVLYFRKQNQKQEIDDSSLSELQKKMDIKNEAVTYSRISFILGNKISASLSIPDFWEGKYRLKKQNNKAIFYYIQGDKEEELFYVAYYKNKKDFSNSNEVILQEKENYFITYYNNENKDKIQKIGAEYEIMKKQIGIIIKSLKISEIK